MWRFVVAVVPLVGILLAPAPDNLSFFTYQSNAFVVLLFGWLVLRGEPRSGGLRGAVTLYITITGVIYNTLLNSGPGAYDAHNALLHVAAPLLVLLDWSFVGDSQSTVRRWHPLLWLLYPLAYLGFVLIRATVVHSYPYFFIDVNEIGYGGLARNSVGLLVGFGALGYALRALGLVSLGRRRTPVPA